MVAHLAGFFRVELRRFSEQPLIDGNHANVVQIARRAQRRHLGRFHPQRFADRLGVAAHAQRVAVNVDVFDVDRGGESFQRVVVEPVQRGQQPQVFGDPLCQRLAESVILNGQCHVVAQHLKSVELVFFVQGIARPASEGNHSNQLSPDLQRANALEQFRRDIAVRTQKDVVGGTVEHDRAGGCGESMYVAGKQGNQRWFRQQCKSLRHRPRSAGKAVR